MQSRRIAGLITAALVLSACAGRRRVGPDGAAGDGRDSAAATPRGGSAPAEATGIYQRMGLIASTAPVPFVASVRFVATARPDSTLAILAVSLPNRALTFARDEDRFRAVYEVRAEFRRGNQPARRIDAQQEVRVASFRETSRGDESVIFQQTLPLAPGQYALSLAVRDGGSARSSVQQATVTVPRLGPDALSSPIAVYEAAPRSSPDSAPRLVASPRATFTFGRDTSASVYLEGYGAGAALPLRLTLRGDDGAALWSGAASLARRGALFSGVVGVPLAPLGVGRVVTLVAQRADARDSTRTAMFVTFGEELPVTTFEDMVSYLRYFSVPERVSALRGTPPARRAAAWAEFLRSTDVDPSTPQNEALRDYFQRVAVANGRYRDEGGPGWLTERGMVFVTLGEPDQIYQQGGVDVNARGRAQIWEYQADRVQLVFIDQSGFGRWRLTTASENDFRQAARRREQTRTGR